MQNCMHNPHQQTNVEYIPSNELGWKIVKIKQVYRIQLGKMLQPKQQSSNEVLVPYLKALHVQWGAVDTDELPEMWISEPDITKYEVVNGDLLICEGGEVGRSAIVTKLQQRTIIQNSLHRIRSSQFASNRYLLYFMQHISKSGWLDVICNKATIAHLTSEKLGDLRIYLPTINEQHRLTSFLDHETAKLDQLVEKKQRLIELLKEKRQAIITQAVTKGLDPNVPMKDSGIPWLGEVPAHWEVERLKYQALIISGHSPHESTYNQDGIGTVLINGPAEYSETDFGYTRSLKWTTDPQKIVGPDVLLICLRGSTTGRLNITHTTVAIGRGVAAILSKHHQPYMNLVIQSARPEIERIAKGSTFPSITSEDLGNFPIPKPPTNEQIMIAKFVEQKSLVIEKSIDKIAVQIDLIKEYRQALISAAVTGRIDVRQYAADEAAPVSS